MSRSTIIAVATALVMAGMVYLAIVSTDVLRIAAIVLQVPVSYTLGTIGLMRIISDRLKSAVRP